MARIPSTYLSRWHNLFQGMQESSQKIYTAIEEEIRRQNLPGAIMSRITYHEKGLLSAKREYLRVRRQRRIFDICAAPFGNNFFISWWLGETPSYLESMLLAIPFIGHFLAERVRVETYYTVDSTLMFHDSVHTAVLNVLDKVTKAKGIRAMTELERKPIIGDLFKCKMS